MQHSLACAAHSRLKEINLLLRKRHGPLRSYARLDPVSQLILSLIGARTDGEVSRKVFVRMSKRFRSWAELIDLPEDALISHLRGLAC